MQQMQDSQGNEISFQRASTYGSLKSKLHSNSETFKVSAAAYVRELFA